jgi:hypothetical protein
MSPHCFSNNEKNPTLQAILGRLERNKELLKTACLQMSFINSVVIGISLFFHVVFIVCNVFFIVRVPLCAVFCLSAACYFV